MRKRVLAIAMTLAMTLSLLPVSALATGTGGTPEEETQSSNSANEFDEIKEDVSVDEVETASTTGLPEAVEGTIKLDKNVELTNTYQVGTNDSNDNITIDLNGYTISAAEGFQGGYLIQINEGSSLNLTDSGKEGKICSDAKNIRGILNHGTFTMDSGKIDVVNYAVTNEVTQNSYEKEQPVICEITGGELTASYAWAVFLRGAGIKGQSDGTHQSINFSGSQEVRNDLLRTTISGNAKVTGDQAITTNASNGIYAGFTLNIGGNAEISGGSNTDNCGIYLPAVGETTISGGTIRGDQGIRIAAGELNITGGMIEGTKESNSQDLIAGASGGTMGAIVVGKAGGGYVGDVLINIGENATVKNTAAGSSDKAAIVVSDKYMSDASKDYDELSITVNVNGATIDGDVVKVSNLNPGDSSDGGTTTLTLNDANVTGDVINQTQDGDLEITGGTITGNVTNASKGSVLIEGVTVNGTVSNTGEESSKGSVTIINSTVTEEITNAIDSNIIIVDSAIGGNEPTTEVGNNVAIVGTTPYSTLVDAIDAAEENNGTVELLKSVEITTALTIEKPITINGKGNTITAKDCAALQVNADLDSLTIRNLTLTGASKDEPYVAGERMDAPYMGLGTYNLGYGVKNLTIEGVTIQGFDYGLYFSSKSDNQTRLSIDADDLTIQGCYIKGAYFEKLTESTFTDCKFINNGDNVEDVVNNDSGFRTWMCGVDLNLKYGEYENITFDGCTFTGNGQNRGTALHIKARDDGNYASPSSKLDGVTVENCTFNNNNATDNKGTPDSGDDAAFGPIVLGEPEKNNKTPINVSIQPDVKFTNNLDQNKTVTVTFNSNGGSEVATQIVEKDGKATQPANPTRDGYTFQGWYLNGAKFDFDTVVRDDLKLEATWTPIQSDRPSSGSGGSSSSDSGDYLISVDRVSGGRVTVQPGRADKGETVTITVYPNNGYELDELVVTDSRGNEIDLDARSATRFTFTMPGGKVNVEASFVREGGQSQVPQTTFMDVPASAWYYDAVEYVYENGLMSGVSSGWFAPNDTLTRAMVVQTLYAMEGRPSAASAGFADVAPGDWYAGAVNWAAANGVVSGVSETSFAPNSALTREQLALILYRYAQYKGYDTTQGGMAIREFADYGSISSWAAEAMGWAVNAGLISGVGGNQIAPTGTATRAQVAQILMNFCENVAR